MTESNKIIGQGAFEPDPPRDVALATLLREQVGGIPMDEVNWNALASGISARIAAHVSSPWWTYASRWERRMVPVALAAGLAATFALFSVESVSSAGTAPVVVSAASVSTAIVSGTPIEEAALQFAHSVTSAGDITDGVPE